MKHSNLTSIIEFVRGAGTQEASFSPANGSNSLFSPQTGEVLSLLLILLMIVVITAMSVAVLRSRVLADSRIGDFLTFRSNKKLRRLAITTIVLIASIVYCVCVCSIAPKAFASSSQYASLTDKVTASVNDQHQITWSESKLTNTSGEYSVKITSCELQKKASAAADVNFTVKVNGVKVFDGKPDNGSVSNASVIVGPVKSVNVEYAVQADNSTIDKLLGKQVVQSVFAYTPMTPITSEVKPLTLTSGGTEFRYWPVFNKNNPPEGIAWYTGFGTGNLQEITNVKSMTDLANKNVDSYAVTIRGAEFTAVRGYNESWSSAFYVNPDTRKTTGVYNGAGKLDDNDFCVPLVEPTFKNLRDMSYWYMADFENPRISILANNPERILRDDLCVKFSDIQDAYGSSICDDTTCNNYWTAYVVESNPGYRTYWNLNQYITTNKFTGWVNANVDNVNGATLFERQFN